MRVRLPATPTVKEIWSSHWQKDIKSEFLSLLSETVMTQKFVCDILSQSILKDNSRF